MAVSEDGEKDNAFFTKMLDLIPTNFYFSNEAKQALRVNEEDEEEPGKQQHGNKKRPREEELSLKAKWKRAKFDPTQIKTVSQMSEEMVKKNHKIQPAKGAGTKSKNHKVGSLNPLQVNPDQIEDLHERLKAKIHLLKTKRHALDKRDEFIKRRLKRNEQKAKRKLKQKQGKQEKTLNGPLNPKPKAPVTETPVFNKEGKMVFSKFDFSEKKKPKKETKNYKKLLEKALKDKEKVEQLKNTDENAAKSLKEKQQWKNVLQKAEGVKVKDNPDLIKKSLKRREKLKEKSRKEWKARTEKVETKMKQRQDKRAANIKKKKEGRINKKVNKAKKKGRIVPGF